MDPLPAYVSQFAIAEKLRVAPHLLSEVPIWWIHAALAVLEAEHIYRAAKESERESRN